MTTKPAETRHRPLSDAIEVALTTEHWLPADPGTPAAGTSAKAWTSPDHTARLLITTTPDGPATAVLTGHPRGETRTPLWTVSILDPTADQVLAAARAAADSRLVAILRLADNLKRTRWSQDSDTPPGTLCQFTSSNRRRGLTRLDGTDHQPSRWQISGDGLTADATDGTPERILEVLALTGEPVPDASDPASPAQDTT